MNTALVSLLLFSAPPPTTASALAYQAPPGCPTQQEFVAAVAARGAEFAEVGEAKRTLVVSVSRQDDGFVGTFQVRNDQIATDKREIHGANCGEVVDALAVVTAIALDPAGDPPQTPPAPEAAAKSSEPATTPPYLRLRGSTRIFPPRRETVQVGAGDLRFDLQRSVTGYLGATVGLIPSVILPRYELSFVVANFVTTPEGAQRIPGPVFQLHLSYLGEGTYSSTDTKTYLNGASFGIGICQSPLYDTRGWVILLCSEYGGGFMNLLTKGADGKQIQSKNAGFGTVNLGAEAQYNFGSIFHVGAKLGGGFNFGQLAAERADGSRIFGNSSEDLLWYAYFMLGAGVHF